MNKTVVFALIVLMAVVAFACGTVLVIYKPEGFLTFTSFVGATIISVSGFATTFYVLNKVNEKVEKVEKQTNGRLTTKDDENEKLRQENLALHRRNAELEKDNA